MNKIIERGGALILAAAAVAIAYDMGVSDGETRGIAPGPVNVSIVYEESGEARSVSLTDSEGLDIPVGSVAEAWPYLDIDYSEES